MSQLRSLVPLLLLSVIPLACKGKPPPPEARHKNREEAFQVFDKHRETYVRCEKLRLKVQPSASEPTSKPPPLNDVLESQRCQSEYWKAMKQDMGPYDQAEVDVWYADWRKGVKIDQ